jgi:uncharacterized protein YegJ (DUF2314 family)
MEDPRNICHTCAKHSSRPQAKYASWDPTQFIGKWVKVGFTEKLTEKMEHLWVKIIEVAKEGKALLGVVNNEPLLNLGVQEGDSIEVSIFEIESCFDGKNVL